MICSILQFHIFSNVARLPDPVLSALRLYANGLRLLLQIAIFDGTCSACAHTMKASRTALVLVVLFALTHFGAPQCDTCGIRGCCCGHGSLSCPRVSRPHFPVYESARAENEGRAQRARLRSLDFTLDCQPVVDLVRLSEALPALRRVIFDENCPCAEPHLRELLQEFVPVGVRTLCKQVRADELHTERLRCR